MHKASVTQANTSLQIYFPPYVLRLHLYIYLFLPTSHACLRALRKSQTRSGDCLRPITTRMTGIQPVSAASPQCVWGESLAAVSRLVNTQI